MGRFFLAFAAASALLAVALGAFAAHGLKNYVAPELLTLFHTGAQYQMYHALALLAIGLLLRLQGHNNLLQASGWLFIGGTLLFSGSLYGLGLGGPHFLGPITPLGGACFLLGWLGLFIAALRLPKRNSL